MGEALLTGLLDADWAPVAELAVVEPLPERRATLEARFSGLTVTAEPIRADGVVIAVKPDDVVRAATALATIDGGAPKRVLSIAAGVALATLEQALPGDVAVVRAMPNTPALVGAGAAAIAGGASASDADLAWAESILAAVGTVVRVPEHLMDAVTGLSGSGPAYVFVVAEALVDAGVLVGLPRPIAATLAMQTLLGSARLLTETGDRPAELRAAVTSPGGTTAAGLRALEDAGIRAAFLDAVTAAAERSRELGGN